MKKFIVETYYTCTFKTVHTLDELNDVELSKIDGRKDGEVEVIEVKLNNRKTKKIGSKNKLDDKKTKKSNEIASTVADQVINSKNNPVNNATFSRSNPAIIMYCFIRVVYS